MAMGKCRECGAEVSDQAKTCPKCGVSRPVRKTSKLTWLATLVIVPVVAMSIINHKPPPPDVEAAPPTPEQLAEKKLDERRFNLAVGALIFIKKNLREPESVVWEGVWVNDAATVICVEYRARNGFGGMNKEVAVITDSKLEKTAKAWNSKCTKGMHDKTSARQAV